jgi:hypothetical protein
MDNKKRKDIQSTIYNIPLVDDERIERSKLYVSLYLSHNTDSVDWIDSCKSDSKVYVFSINPERDCRLASIAFARTPTLGSYLP